MSWLLNQMLLVIVSTSAKRTGVKNLRITNQTEVFLKLMGDKCGSLVWERGKPNETSRVILHGHYPTHHLAIYVLFTNTPHINQVHLEPVTEIG